MANITHESLMCPGGGDNRGEFISSASSLLHPNNSFFGVGPGGSTLPSWRSLDLNHRPRRVGGAGDVDEGDSSGEPVTTAPVIPDLMMPTLGVEDGAVGRWLPSRSTSNRGASAGAGDARNDFPTRHPSHVAQHEEVAVARRNHFDPDECEESRPSSMGASSPLLPRRKRKISTEEYSEQGREEFAVPLPLRPLGRKRTMPRRRDSLERLLDRSTDLLLDSRQLGSSAEAA